MEQKKICRPGVRTSSETNTPPSWLALICIGQVKGEETKCIKTGSQDGLKHLLWGPSALMPQKCTILCLPNKTLSSNRVVTLVRHFKSLLWQDRTEQSTHSPDYIYIMFNTVTTNHYYYSVIMFIFMRINES